MGVSRESQDGRSPEVEELHLPEAAYIQRARKQSSTSMADGINTVFQSCVCYQLKRRGHGPSRQHPTPVTVRVDKLVRYFDMQTLSACKEHACHAIALAWPEKESYK